jgi:hypothetical protein
MPEGTRYRRARRPSGAKEEPVRSVRVGDELWEKLKRRAAYEGVTASNVLFAFVEGYAAGLVDMPVVRPVYSPPRQPAVQVEVEAG